jgi:hypothetical protein
MRKLTLLVVALFFALDGWALGFTVDSINYSTTGSTTVEVAEGSYSGAITIPSSVVYDHRTYTVTAIVNNAFLGCTGITSITIPSSVKRITMCAFYYCTSLSSLKIHATTPPLLGEYVFSKIDTSKCVLYVPTGSLSAYKAANQWNDLLTIIPL